MRDIAVIGVMTFIIAIFFVIIATTFTPIFSAFQNNTVVANNTLAVASFQSGQTNIINRLDYVLLILFICFVIFSLVISYFISAYPIAVFFYYLALIIISVVTAVLSYVWHNMKDTPTILSTIQTQFPITNHILTNFVLYMAVVGFLSVIAMYAKPQE